jgi:hypothetical protein
LATTPSSDVVIVPDDERDRILLKRFLAYLETLRRQHWMALDFPQERISSRPAVQAIAMEDTGRTTAIEHIRLEGLTEAQPAMQRFLAVMRPIGADRSLHVPDCQIDVTVSVDLVRPAMDLKLVATALRAWCARQLATLPEGSSHHVIAMPASGLRLRVENVRCPGNPGVLRILHTGPPQYFDTAIHDSLERQLGRLVSASADRRVLLFENSDGSWCGAQLRVELTASVEFTDLNLVDEIWVAGTDERSLESPSFQRVMANSTE